MCGRYFLEADYEELETVFGIEGGPVLAPRYNIAPTQPVPVVHQSAVGRRELTLMRWGLVPAWSKGPDSRFSMINARAETLAGKPAYRAAYRYRRCIVPASGFFEWRRESGHKQPYVLRPADGGLLALGGLWEEWLSPEGDELASCAIIVRPANERVKMVHDRMPLALAPGDFDLWLDRHVQRNAQTDHLLRADGMPELSIYPVSRHVNNPRNDTDGLLKPLEKVDASY